MSCLKCLKYTMCVVNFIFFICGVAILGVGIYFSVTSQYVSIFTSMSINFASSLYILGIFITCVSFLGFIGAVRENRCLLITFFMLLFVLMLAELVVACLLLLYETEVKTFVKKELEKSLNTTRYMRHENMTYDWDTIQKTFKCCGVHSNLDWNGHVPASCCEDPTRICNSSRTNGCLKTIEDLFSDNLLGSGIAVITICSIEVLGMCFAMTLFCHISKSGLGYK